ncbi:MAG: hydantoinase/oxoprolinase family protein [Desulforhopalus sp.]
MALIVGIDVGGTHADGVLLDGSTLLAKNKVEVDQENLSNSIIPLLRSLVPKPPHPLTRIHLSTTLCTNAIVSDTLDTVGMLIQSGPGMNPGFLNVGEHVCLLDGTIDHRGHSLKTPSLDLVERSAVQFANNGIESIGVVTKFSHRNNSHEQAIHDQLADRFAHISMGHRISGLPNFPRRVYSTWLNAALRSKFVAFQRAMETGLRHLQLDCPCHILKADGGTMPFAVAATLPCESVHSGPSASVMGCLALEGNNHDAVLLDIGGTTTDIAILAEGVPLLEPYGVTVNGRPTLIRALNTRSIGLGGDSAVTCTDGEFSIGPRRKGSPMALGGKVPTPTDAMIVLGTLQIGSRAAAEQAMCILAPAHDPKETAVSLLKVFGTRIKEAVDLMIDEVFSRPVFTVSALLNLKRIVPEEIIAVGGPAEAMREIIGTTFTLPCKVPQHYEVANAIGAARTRPTLQATLYADTSDGRLSIPEIGCREKISARYTMQDAEDRLTTVITALARDVGMKTLPQIDFLERQQMNTIRGFRTTGKILSLKAQLQPGLQQL